MKKLRTLLLTMTFMLLQAITVMAADAGDSMADATSISTGSNYSGYITETNSTDYYNFTLNKSGIRIRGSVFNQQEICKKPN